MELNSLIFPAPSPSYGPNDLKELLWIPRHFKNGAHKIITKNFKARTVKASILEDSEAIALSSNRNIKIIKQFENVKVQASIYKKDSNSEEETREEKPPMTIIKDFNNYSVKASLIDKEKESELNVSDPNNNSKDFSEKIPCLWIKYKSSSKLMIYFHGNAEDIGISSEFVEILSKNLKVKLLISLKRCTFRLIV